jgi:hypothetical protein
MSQQHHMHFDDDYGTQAEEKENKSSFFYGASVDQPGQKLSFDTYFTSYSPGQRLALAIVSITIWALLFSLAVLILILTPAYISVPSTIPGGIPTVIDNPNLHILYPILGLGLLVFSIIIIIINVLFNRKH